MKNKPKNEIQIAAKVPLETIKMIEILREKHCVNISELIRNSISNKYKELESK